MQYHFIGGDLAGLATFDNYSDTNEWLRSVCKSAQPIVAPSNVWFLRQRETIHIYIGDPTLTLEEAENLPHYEIVGNLFLWVEGVNVRQNPGRA